MKADLERFLETRRESKGKEWGRKISYCGWSIAFAALSFQILLAVLLILR